MAIKRMDNAGSVVDYLDATIAFLVSWAFESTES